MTDAKQEAQRIFERFYNETLSHLSDHITREDAIQSALICVDEMAKFSITEGVYEPEDIVGYIMKLKQEIKNLRR